MNEYQYEISKDIEFDEVEVLRNTMIKKAKSRYGMRTMEYIREQDNKDMEDAYERAVMEGIE